MSGCHWYLGCKGAGKTTRAYRDLAEEVAATGRPALILDVQDRMADVADVARVDSVKDALRALYVYERHAMMSSPRVEDCEAVLRGVLAGGEGVLVLIDECGVLCDARAIVEPLDVLMRNTRKGVSLRLTSQRLGDLHQNAFATADRIYVYRLQASADLDRAERAFGLERAKVATLPQFEFIDVPLGFGHGSQPARVEVKPETSRVPDEKAAESKAGTPAEGVPNPSGS